MRKLKANQRVRVLEEFGTFAGPVPAGAVGILKKLAGEMYVHFPGQTSGVMVVDGVWCWSVAGTWVVSAEPSLFRKDNITGGSSNA